MIRNILFVVPLVFLASCSALPEWVGDNEDAPIAGERISVLSYKSKLVADKNLKDAPIVLPVAKPNVTWALQGFTPYENLKIPSVLKRRDIISVGEGLSNGRKLSATPIVAKGVVYTLDGSGKIQARSEKNMEKVIWQLHLDSGKTDDDFLGYSVGKTDKEFTGGSIAYFSGRLFVTTSLGEILSIDAKKGKVIWRKSLGIPVKSPPFVKNKRIYFVSADNRLIVLSAASGKTIWSHAGLAEETTTAGAPSPVVAGQVVVLAYSSGELYGLGAETGKTIWRTSLSGVPGKGTSHLALSDIDATPVVAGGTVYAISHEGILAAVDLRSGKTKWRQEISGNATPWYAGDYLFLLTSNDELICVHAKTGRIKWVQPLQKYQEATGWADKGRKILWSGPVIANSNLFVVGSHGSMHMVSPKTGKSLQEISVMDDISLPPVIANGKMYLMNNSADILVLE